MNELTKIARPIEVTILALLYFISALLAIVAAVSAIGQNAAQWQTRFTTADFAIVAWVLISVLIPSLIALGLWRLSPEVRAATIFLAGAGLVLLFVTGVTEGVPEDTSTLITLGWASVSMLCLNTPRARRAFGKFGNLGVSTKLLMAAIPLILIMFLIGRSKVMIPQLNIPNDVRAITFISNRRAQTEHGVTGGPTFERILTMNTNGGEIAYLKGTTTIVGPGTWSPDGRAYAIYAFNDETKHFCLILFDSSGHRCLVKDGFTPSWSPDGRYIAYSTSGSFSSVPENTRSATINLLTMSTGVVTPMVTLPPPVDAVSHTVFSHITWSPDGETIAYSIYTYGISGTEVVEDAGSIWLFNMNAQRPTFLTSGQSPAWSPTRNEIAFDRDQDIWLYNLDMRTETVFIDDPVRAYYPAWSPDGEQILFTSKRDGNSEIYRINRDGTQLTRLTNDSAADFAPMWRPNP